MGQTTRKSSTETSIETGVVQAIETLLRRVMYVNHLSSYLRHHIHCLILAPLRTHLPTTEMRNSTLNNTWCKCFADEMWCCICGTVFSMLLADTSMLGIECSSARLLIIHNVISLEEFHEEAQKYFYIGSHLTALMRHIQAWFSS